MQRLRAAGWVAARAEPARLALQPARALASCCASRGSNFDCQFGLFASVNAFRKDFSHALFFCNRKSIKKKKPKRANIVLNPAVLTLQVGKEKTPD